MVNMANSDCHSRNPEGPSNQHSLARAYRCSTCTSPRISSFIAKFNRISISHILILCLLHRVLYRGALRFERLLKQVILLLDVISQVLPVELRNGIQFHDDRRRNVLERLRRVELPACALKLWHVKGPIALDFPLRFHLVENALL